MLRPASARRPLPWQTPPGKGFFSTRGGMQVMTDYEFIAAEMKAREAEFTEKEKERKQRKEFHERP